MDHGDVPAISLPQGGGALHGLGEKFAADLHTGTGNLSVPLPILPGRNGFGPSLSLDYSTGHGNGVFGMGWTLGVPSVSRKTSCGIPRYGDSSDVFLLSGAEDLVPVPGAGQGRQLFRPRTEGLFGRIERHSDATHDHWDLRTRDGLFNVYGTPGARGEDPAAVADPDDPRKVFAWMLTRTEDPFGNVVLYDYERDTVRTDGPHRWDQVRLAEVRYVDTGSDPQRRFLNTVRFSYESRPDPFSEYRAGFEIRTVARCAQIEILTDGALVRVVNLDYADSLDDLGALPHSGVSLLAQIRVSGRDSTSTEPLPPLSFRYTTFTPAAAPLVSVGRPGSLPNGSWSGGGRALVDLFGRGLPDIVEMNGTARFWRNLGGGRFAPPQTMADAPAGIAPGDRNVILADADGDGHGDLLVLSGSAPGSLAGYFPLGPDGRWDRRSFRRHRFAPTFELRDPEVRLVDLDGDGVIDAVRSGTRLECFFNDRVDGWSRVVTVAGGPGDNVPAVRFSDPRVHWADMTGDGMQDPVLVVDGSVVYWPSLGHGRWGSRVRMRSSPRFPTGYDPTRVLLADVDGDGVADLAYVDATHITVWINRSGNSWSEPIVITGTPPVAGAEVSACDLFGGGTSGLLWSGVPGGGTPARPHYLDLTAGTKPYLLAEIDNHIGGTTRIEYSSSTASCLLDDTRPATRWRTRLPVPVPVVARVQSVDWFSGGRLTSEFSYHHGYWDGEEREFRGFGLVDQLDTETFEQLRAGTEATVAPAAFSPPTLTRTWFHQGAVGDGAGGWRESDLSAQAWPGDPALLERRPEDGGWLAALPPAQRRNALRSLRGRVVRIESYALDGTARADHPFTVTECLHGVAGLPVGKPVPEHLEPWQHRVFFPHELARRTTHWDRGDDPLTQVSLTADYDVVGQARESVSVALPRRERRRHPVMGAEVGAIDPDEVRVLASLTLTRYAHPDQGVEIHDRVGESRTWELVTPPTLRESSPDDLRAVLRDQMSFAYDVRRRLREPGARRLVGHTVHHYDGAPFAGRPAGELGPAGALTRTEALVLTPERLQAAYGDERPDYLGGHRPLPAGAPPGFGTATGYRFEDQPPYEGGWYADTSQLQHSPRGLVVAARDGLGHLTQVRYDAADLLPVEVSDPAGLVSRAEYDPRVLQVRSITDHNGNQTRFAYSPFGFLSATWVGGKAGDTDGDRDQPSVRYERDFLAYDRSRQEASREREPVFTRLLRRTRHDGDTTAGSATAGAGTDDTGPELEQREFIDGFGRPLQTRTLAEDELVSPDPAGGALAPEPGGDTDRALVQLRQNAAPEQPDVSMQPDVVVGGWQLYDNKGRVVQRFEAYFDRGWGYRRPSAGQLGRRTVTHYDARGRVVRTDGPDGSQQRVVFGVPADLSNPDTAAPTPWELYTYDANDCAPLAADPVTGQSLSDRAPAEHHFTPASTITDALGRTLAAVARPGPDPVSWHVTRSAYDLRGNLLAVTDALGRQAFSCTYDLADRRLRVESVDAGTRTIVFDAVGNRIEEGSGRGSLALSVTDALNRPVAVHARDTRGDELTLRERMVYGDTLADQDDARSRNVRGELVRCDDQAGRLDVERYDFKGNAIERVRRVPMQDVLVRGSPLDWRMAVPLALREYRTSLAHDALGRVITFTYPTDANGHRSVLTRRYNRAGMLTAVAVDGVGYVERIAYDARGERLIVAFGNGVMTRYAYHPRSLALCRIRSEGYTVRDGSLRPRGPVLQDTALTLDLVGNVVRTRERSPSSGLPADPDRLDRAFEYDPLYRLRTATGRECEAAQPAPWDVGPRCTDLTRSRPYTRHYSYDPAGNLVQVRHRARSGSHSRTLSGSGVNNRLNGFTTGSTAIIHEYDPDGNLVREAESRRFTWDHADRLIAYRTQANEGPASVTGHYAYDGAGRRVITVERHQGGTPSVCVTVDGVFEHVAEAGLENTELRIMDDRRGVALVRSGPALPGDGSEDAPVRYHLEDQVGSATVVIGGSSATGASVIRREEYYPYGETSFGSYARKRYRYCGNRRDAGSGLYYVGSRYYAPWVARWVNCDPYGTADGLNLYTYARNNPVTRVDPSGTESLPGGTDPPKEERSLPAEGQAVQQGRDGVITIAEVTIVGKPPPAPRAEPVPSRPASTPGVGDVLAAVAGLGAPGVVAPFMHVRAPTGVPGGVASMVETTGEGAKGALNLNADLTAAAAAGVGGGLAVGVAGPAIVAASAGAAPEGALFAKGVAPGGAAVAYWQYQAYRAVTVTGSGTAVTAITSNQRNLPYATQAAQRMLPAICRLNVDPSVIGTRLHPGYTGLARIPQLASLVHGKSVEVVSAPALGPNLIQTLGGANQPDATVRLLGQVVNVDWTTWGQVGPHLQRAYLQSRFIIFVHQGLPTPTWPY